MVNPEQHGQLLSQEGIDPIAQCITAAVPEFPQNAHDTLQSFLQDIRSRSVPSAIAVIQRQEGFQRPSLDFFVLWPPTETLFSDAEEEEIETVGEKHDELVRRLFPVFDSQLHILHSSPSAWPNIVSTELSSWWHTAGTAQIICCQELKKLES